MEQSHSRSHQRQERTNPRIMMKVGDRVQTLRFDPSSQAEPALCSTAIGWSGVPFELHRLRSSEGLGECGPLNGEHGLMVVISGHYETVVQLGGQERRFASSPGTMQFMAGDERPNVLSITGEAEVMAMHCSPRWLQQFSIDPRSLRGRPPQRDGETARALALAMRAEVAAGCPTGTLFAESLSLAMLSFAIGQLPPTEPTRHGRFDARGKAHVASYIREHLQRNLSLVELAALLDLKPRQFSESFRKAFGTTPHRYVLDERLAHAARLLEAARHSIAEVAMQVGFCSQSHFTTEFRRRYGMTPLRYVRERRISS
jgi:AraC family transcriptional regulator